MIYKHVIKTPLANTAKQRRSCPNPCLRTTRRACTSIRAYGKARATCSTAKRTMQSSVSSGVIISAACSNMPGRSADFALRRQIPTAGLFRDMKRQFIWSTRSVTVPLAVVSRCIRRIRARSVLSSAHRIPPAWVLAFAAMLLAGLDGIERRTDPGEPIDKNLYHLPPKRPEM